MTVDLDAALSFRNDLVAAVREGLGVPEIVAVPMAECIAAALTRRLGGLYVPKREMREDRDKAVLRDFDGRNHAEVIRRHKISRRTLYRIINQKHP